MTTTQQAREIGLRYFPRLSGSENHRGFIIRDDDGGLVAEVSPRDPDGTGGECFARMFVASNALLAACEDALMFLASDETDTYCTHCERHADKDDDGTPVAPIPHAPDCPVTLIRAAVAKAKGTP